MPTLYDAVSLADYSYNYDSAPPPGWEKINISYSEDNYKYEKLGYLGAMLVNKSTSELVIVHRGTEWKDIDNTRRVKTSVHNLKSDAAIFLHVLPSETLLALEFSQKIPEEYNKYTVIHIGHSLGGFHAHICGYYNNSKVISFDAPGCFPHLQKAFLEIDFSRRENHINLVLMENIINVVNIHFGTIYVKKSDQGFQNGYKSPERDLVGSLKYSHSLRYFADNISLDSPDPFYSIPENFITLEEYMESKAMYKYKNIQNDIEKPPLKKGCAIL